MAEGSSEMTVYKSVYVGNIPEYLDHDDDFRDIFMQYTDFVHSARIIRDFHSQWSRGFGFLVVSEEDAEKLIRRSTSGNPIVIGGQELRIKRATEERPFKQKKFIPTPGYNGYKRPTLPEFVSYEENEPGKPTIHSLNDDVLKAIFKYFDFKELIGIERVCRRWQFLIYERYRGMSWCYLSDVVETVGVSLTYFQKDIVPRFPTEDPRCDLFTRILKYQNLNWARVSWKQIVDKILLIVGENLPNLSLSRFRGTYSESRALAQLVPNLETLCVTGTSDLVNLFPITETCKNLTHLFLNNISIDKNVMTAIAECEKLETLSGTVVTVNLLSNLPKTVKNLQVQLVEKHLDMIVLNIQHLKDLERLSFYRKCQPIVPIVMLQTPTKVSFNSRHIKSLAENHQNLTYLYCFTREESVDYSALTNLEHLHLEGKCPLSLFDNLPPKLELLSIFPEERWMDSPYSVDLSSKLPSSLQSFIVCYQYLDLESLLTLKDVPSVTKLVVFSDESYRFRGSSLQLLDSLVTIPNLQEMYINHLDPIDQQELNEITVSRKNSLAKVKKNDNLNQEKHPLLLYVNSFMNRKQDSEHIKLVSISKPMLDGVVFPHAPIADDSSSLYGFADLLRDQLFLDDILDGEGLADDAFGFEFGQMLQHELFDDFVDELDDFDDEFDDFDVEFDDLDDEFLGYRMNEEPISL